MRTLKFVSMGLVAFTIFGLMAFPDSLGRLP